MLKKLTPEAVLAQVPEGYTPGDWNASSSGYANWDFKGGYLGVIHADWNAFKKVYTGPSSFHAIRGDTREQAEANAKLMAMGPRLVFALKAALSERDVLRKALIEADPRHELLKVAGPWEPDTTSNGAFGWVNGRCRKDLSGLLVVCTGTLHGDDTWCPLNWASGDGDTPGGEAEADAWLAEQGWRLE